VVIEVQDRGPGIPPEALGALFTAYFRARNASGGTGLGLMISREIVRQHGGEIRAASVLGQGATFTVVLPARAAAT
jgi:signal transduction histidine kinase